MLDSIGPQLKNGFYLAIVYLIISSNFLGNLFGCRIQQLFANNMPIKHLLAFLTVFFLIVLSDPPEGYTIKHTIGLTFAIYLWFYLTTKMHVSFWLPMILSVFLAFVLYTYKKEAGSELSKERQDQMEKIQTVAVIFAGVLTVIGVAAYYGEKKLEYDADFDPTAFWFGKPDCKYATPPTSISDSLAALFR
jgi:membrane protein implicated in regulation of membrane protease activity